MRRWLFGGGTFAGVVKLCFIFGAAAVLITLMGSYTVMQQFGVTTQGLTQPRVAIDGVFLSEDTYNMPEDDIGTLGVGDTVTVPHTFFSESTDGSWTVFWDNSEFMTWFDTPTDPNYGYTFTTTDTEGNEISYVDIFPGDTKTVNFNHNLDLHFAALPEGTTIPYKLQMHIEEYIGAPLAVEDHVGIGRGVAGVIYPLANDIDYSGNGMEIISIGTLPAYCTASISADGQSINWYMDTTSASFTYTIVSMDVPVPREATATIYVT